MKIARWIFGIAGMYGILVIAPLYFAEARIGRDDPPPIGFGCIDLLFGALFVVAFFVTSSAARTAPAAA